MYYILDIFKALQYEKRNSCLLFKAMKSSVLRALRLLRIAGVEGERPTTFRLCSTAASTSNAAAATVAAPQPSLDTQPLKMIPKELHERLFGVEAPAAYCEDAEARAWATNLEMPPLLGNGGAFEHFNAIAREEFAPYERLLEAAFRFSECKPPPRPASWRYEQGWTRYEADGRVKSVEAPLEDVLFFDVETCVSESQVCCLFSIALCIQSCLICSCQRLQLLYRQQIGTHGAVGDS